MRNVLRQQTLAVATGSETFKVQSEFKMAEHLDSLQRANLPSSLWGKIFSCPAFVLESKSLQDFNFLI